MKILGDRDIEESRLNNWVSLTFRLGIAVSLALIIIGFVILLIISGTGDIQQIVIRIGILLLLVTPIIQVITAIVLFSIARDRLFIGISAAVFCFASISLALALI